jgi:TM2 domain-containing membrane protein YozV
MTEPTTPPNNEQNTPFEQPAQTQYTQPVQPTYQAPQPQQTPHYQQQPPQYTQPAPQYQQPGQQQYAQPNQQGYQAPQQPQYQAPQGYQGYQPYGQQPYAVSTKSKLAAGLLGIFLGSLGVHNFYLGYTTKAVIQLLLTVLAGWIFGLGAIAAAIWSLVEAILILTSQPGSPWHKDAQGFELQD